MFAVLLHWSILSKRKVGITISFGDKHNIIINSNYRLRNDFSLLCLGDHLYETNYDAYFDKYSPHFLSKLTATEKQDIENVSTLFLHENL